MSHTDSSFDNNVGASFVAASASFDLRLMSTNSFWISVIRFFHGNFPPSFLLTRLRRIVASSTDIMSSCSMIDVCQACRFVEIVGGLW